MFGELKVRPEYSGICNSAQQGYLNLFYICIQK